tara:strand:+ start:148 stop:768 length:621 start_codon:yes stop_codon:yes gene_type:complete
MELNEKQIHILLVAEKLIAESGFDGASVRKIAKAAKVNVAMISYYFGSKEKLLSALMTYRTSDFRIKAESVLSENSSYLERVDLLIALVIKRIHANRRMYKIVHFEYSNENRKLDVEHYVNQKLENYSVIENFIKAGQEAGVFTKNVDISLIFPTILGTYFNFYYNKPFFKVIHHLDNANDLDDFVFNTLTKHVQKTIKALLTYEI